MENLKLHIRSFGCQMNKLDTELVTTALTAAGLTLTDHPTQADVVIINTCSVRDHAEQRVLSNLGHLKHLKKSRPNLLVAVIGCMAQRLGSQLLDHPAVDIVAGPVEIPRIPDLIKSALADRAPHLAITEEIRNPTDPAASIQLDKFEQTYDRGGSHIPAQAFIRVMRGCNNFCTYCIVPYVRGPEVSRDPEEILTQARQLADAGIKKITLLGQTVNSYNYKKNGSTKNLADLLEMLYEIPGIEWISFITSHPLNFTDDIFHAMAEIPKVCPYLHIPAQSGSDKILKAMNRKYTRSQYLELIARGREIVPDIAIASDFIVGFPGESDHDFQQTIDLVKRAHYKNCFIFKYSPRPGTRADSKLADSIPENVKKQRNTALLETVNKIAAEDNKRFIGKTIRVLVEGFSKKPHLNAAENKNLPQLTSRTATDYIVVFNGPESLIGKFTEVKIKKTSPLTLFAKLTR
jgi:tRNA-2-methylthio-N6-dimethylallyladenosine synthase